MLRFVVLSLLLSAADVAGQVPSAPGARFIRSETNGGVVTVYYDLVTPSIASIWTVALEASLDGGRTYTIKATTVSGDVGANQSPGSGKTIQWQAARDVETLQLDRLTFRVIATQASTRSAEAPQDPERAGEPGFSRALVGGGLSFNRDAYRSLGAGVVANVLVNVMKTDAIAFGVVGNVAAHHQPGEDFTTVHAGLRVTGKGTPRVAPFGEVLFGRLSAKRTDSRQNGTATHVGGAGGVDVRLTPRVNVSAEVWFIHQGIYGRFVRTWFGVSIPFGQME